jgi:type IV pilus assembly protein PilC
MDEAPKLYKVTVSDPTTNSRLSRTVLATHPQMAEGMVPSGESDVITVVEASPLEKFLVMHLHPLQPKIKDQRNFFNGMARALALNPDLVRALELGVLGIQNHYLRLAVARMIEDLREYGEDVRTAVGRFKNILSNDKIAMLETGAASGELGSVFKRISENVEKQNSVMKKVSGALVYPSIVLVMGVVSVIILSMTLFKQMKGMFTSFGAKLPLVTQILMNMTDFFNAYWWVVLPLLILIPFLISRNWIYIYRQDWVQDFIDRSKYLRHLRWKTSMSQCLAGFALLLGSNVPIQDALELTSVITEHRKIRKFFIEVERSIMSGSTFDEACQRNVQLLGEEAVIFLAQIRLGSQTGNLDNIIKKMAENYAEEVDEQVGLLSQFIEPIILMVLGGFVAMVVVSVYLPMVTLYQSVL